MALSSALKNSGCLDGAKEEGMVDLGIIGLLDLSSRSLEDPSSSAD